MGETTNIKIHTNLVVLPKNGLSNICMSLCKTGRVEWASTSLFEVKSFDIVNKCCI